MPPPLRIALVHFGSKYGNLYLERFVTQIRRSTPSPVHITVYTDHPRLPSKVDHIVNLPHLDLPGYFNKLALFNQEWTGPDPFLYLDLTALVLKPLTQIQSQATDTNRPLTLVQDWNHDTLNTSVMTVTPGPHTQQIWDTFQSDPQTALALPGDQNYIDFLARTTSLQNHVATFPNGLVESYRRLRRLHAQNPAFADQKLRDATILKFHGTPKMHQVHSVKNLLVKGVFRFPCRPQTWTYLHDLVKTHWLDLPTRA